MGKQELFQPQREDFDAEKALIQYLDRVSAELPAVLQICIELIEVRKKHNLPLDGGQKGGKIAPEALRREQEEIKKFAAYPWTFGEINAIQIFEVLIRHLSQNSSFARQHLLASPPAESPVKTPAA